MGDRARIPHQWWLSLGVPLPIIEMFLSSPVISQVAHGWNFRRWLFWIYLAHSPIVGPCFAVAARSHESNICTCSIQRSLNLILWAHYEILPVQCTGPCPGELACTRFPPSLKNELRAMYRTTAALGSGVAALFRYSWLHNHRLALPWYNLPTSFMYS